MLDRVRGLATLLRLALRMLRVRVPALDLDQRLAALPRTGVPLRESVDIYWSDQAIPFVAAANLDDLATGFGVVHGHLRLAQLEFMRRLAQGRISELVGGLGLELDIALRTMDLGRAVPTMIERLPPATRRWMECYLGGLNHIIANAPALPPEFLLLGIGRAPWSLADLLSVGRLAAADITWALSLRLLQIRERMSPTEWATLWPELLADGIPVPSGPLAGTARGSNSAAIGGVRTRSGKALIASDPHVSLQLPSIWVACGLAAPGFHAAGLTVPGIPSIAIGRNESIAWGATNLHAASSVMVDLSRESDPQITERMVDIAVRGAANRRIVVRDSRFGPIISDAKLFKLARPTALGWVGHQASDETTAMLAVNRAQGLQEFRAALRGYAVQGYTFTYADSTGQVALVRAAHVPRRVALPRDLIENGTVIEAVVNLADAVGHAGHEAADVVVSSNENPDTDVLAGFFFAPPDRALRQAELLSGNGLCIDDLRALQRDVLSRGALRFRDAIALRACRLGIGLPDEVMTWDGRYDADSVAALAYETLIAEIARRLITTRDLEPLLAVWTGRQLLGRRILNAADDAFAAAIRGANGCTQRVIHRGSTWGEAHRAVVRHPLASLPFGSGRFDACEFGAPGSNDTVYKTGHPLVAGGRSGRRHRVSYGASARHITDFMDVDDNFVVLPGGQDGWPRSANAADQLTAWCAGRYFRLPLRLETAARDFTRGTRLTPRDTR